MSILEQIQSDTRTAMKAGDRGRAEALRLLTNALQQDAKLGKGDELAVLQSERKKRLDAAEAFRAGGAEDRARAEEAEAEIVATYLPAQLSDDELESLVAEAVEQTGASGPGDMGKVMGAVMPRLQGRADGKRVSDAVRSRLAA